MKGSLTLRILESLESVALDATDLFSVFTSCRYGTSLSGFEYALSVRRRERSGRESDAKDTQRYHAFIYQMKKSGLLVQKINRGSKMFFISKRGKEKLEKLRGYLSLSRSSGYRREASETRIVVVFDIPEAQKKKRNWLRATLRDLGMKLIQKSVWIGNCKIPKELIKDLRELGIIQYVEIFEIVREGSLANRA